MSCDGICPSASWIGWGPRSQQQHEARIPLRRALPLVESDRVAHPLGGARLEHAGARLEREER
eukprot:352856-Prymnesium_polylepis.1